MKNTTVLAGIATILFSGSALANDAEEYGIIPLPSTVEINHDKAKLGKKLFNDPLLSVDGTISCASCHDLAKGGTDQTAVSIGVGGQKGPINSPTIYNSEHNFVQFWDGRANNLAEQALGPVENPKEMGENWTNVINKLNNNEEYKAAFGLVYGGAITKENAADAIAEFERTLITPDSPFDKYLRGDKNAISAQALKGYELFKDKGCVSCHDGPYLGGASYQAMSEDYFIDRGNITEADFGRFNVTKDEYDKYTFKVPMLRNIAVTAPYFHDGQVKTLQQAVSIMAKYQLGEELSDSEAKSITEFLESLTGQYKGVSLDKIEAE